MARLKKAYGKHRLVCYRHRSKIGGAVMSFGYCQNCNQAISSSCGGLPKLCDRCSVALSECAECRERLAVVLPDDFRHVDEMRCPVPCSRCGEFIELSDSKWVCDGVGRKQGVCENCFEEGDDE